MNKLFTKDIINFYDAYKILSILLSRCRSVKAKIQIETCLPVSCHTVIQVTAIPGLRVPYYGFHSMSSTYTIIKYIYSIIIIDKQLMLEASPAFHGIKANCNLLE